MKSVDHSCSLLRTRNDHVYYFPLSNPRIAGNPDDKRLWVYSILFSVVVVTQVAAAAESIFPGAWDRNPNSWHRCRRSPILCVWGRRPPPLRHSGVNNPTPRRVPRRTSVEQLLWSPPSIFVPLSARRRNASFTPLVKRTLHSDTRLILPRGILRKNSLNTSKKSLSDVVPG